MALLNQLFDISRLEAGKMKLERWATDLTPRVEQVVSDMRVWSDRHVISLEAPPGLEAEVDPLRVEQVLTNLLDNAIKYSPAGGPIEVVLAPVDGGAVELSVRDHGLGIPPEKRGRLFERFHQAHENSHRSGVGVLALEFGRHGADSLRRAAHRHAQRGRRSGVKERNR